MIARPSKRHRCGLGASLLSRAFAARKIVTRTIAARTIAGLSVATWTLTTWTLVAERGVADPVRQADADEPSAAFEGFTESRFPRSTLPRIVDLDGDGRVDLLFRAGRRIEIHDGTEPGVDGPPFAIEPDRILELPADAVLLDTGEFDGDPATVELAWLGAEGVGWTRAARPAPGRRPMRAEDAPGERPSDGRPSEGRVARSATDAPWPVGAGPSWHDFVRDVDGNGIEDLLLPARTGLRLIRRGVDLAEAGRDELRTIPRGRVRARLWNLSGTIAASIAWPQVVIGDLDGDGRPDLTTVTPDGLRRRFQREDGSFPTEPDQRLQLAIREANLMPDQRRGSIPGRNPLAFPDLDGDGVLDLVVNEMRTGLVKVYRGERTIDPAKPTSVLRIGRWNLGARFPDLDGDGRPDLALPGTREVGLAEGLRLVLSRSLRLTHWLHASTGEAPGFDARPRREITHSIPLGIDATASESTEAGFSIRPSLLIAYDGDYDGDGCDDLLVLEAEDRISLYRRGPTGFWSDEPTDRIPVPSVTGWRDVTELVDDFDGDGRSDVWLRYRGGPEDDFSLLLRTGGSSARRSRR